MRRILAASALVFAVLGAQALAAGKPASREPTRFAGLGHHDHNRVQRQAKSPCV